MNREIDLKNYRLHTDLALEALEKRDYDKEVEEFNKTKVTRIYIDDEMSNKVGKKVGNYVTIEFDDVTDSANKKKVEEVLVTELKKLLKQNEIDESKTCLIIGLGNDKSTPDSLGPLVINKVLVTAPLFDLGSISDGFSKTKALEPGVMGKTGIETSDLICSVVNKIKPDFLIVIDALASQSINRLNKTIQMTDAGIHPGSGIGNRRKPISKDLLNIPVIAIGIPTVVDAVTIVADTINYMQLKYSYTKQNIKNPLYKLTSFNDNYLNKSEFNKEDRHKLLGLIGSLDDYEIKELLYEVLSPIGYNLMVTPKEVDFVIEQLSDVIAFGINKSLHKSYTL